MRRAVLHSYWPWMSYSIEQVARAKLHTSSIGMSPVLRSQLVLALERSLEAAAAVAAAGPADPALTAPWSRSRSRSAGRWGRTYRR